MIGDEMEMTGMEALREAEQSVDQAARRAYELHKRSFVPCYPFVFVRVLPKDQIMQNGLYLPAVQNKTVHEGIVLATWQPFINVKGHKKECNLMPGDHVLFPHFSGVPIEGYSNMLYRVIRSEDWKENEQGGIFAKVEYDSPTPILTLQQVINGFYSAKHDFSTLELAEAIERRFLLLDKEATSVTLSGR